MDNTYCKNCMFAGAADSEESCSMKIIDSIKDSKSITVKENYNYINNYICKYGLSKETYFKYYDEFHKIDIKSYILNKKLLNYYLVIDFTNSSSSVKECCENINSLSILPNFISFIFYNNNDSKNIIDTIGENLEKSIKWKVHNFLENIDKNDMLEVIFDTNSNANNTDFFWISTPENIVEMIEKDSINNINYIVHVLQPSCGFLKFNKNKDNYNGLFMTFTNYKSIKESIKKTLDLALQELIDLNPDHVMYYED